MGLSLTNQFKRSINNDPLNCVLIVGAGLSTSKVRKGGKGLPDWHTLIKHMIEDLKNAQSCSSSRIENLENTLSQGDYLEIASEYKQRTTQDQYNSFLREELDPPDLSNSKVHLDILETRFRGIITTNYDMVFEKQKDQLKPLVYPQCLDEIYLFSRNGFFAKIHGCIRSTSNPSKNLVLTKESFNLLAEDKRYLTMLQMVFLSSTILTVGYSLRDPDFLILIDDLKKTFKDSTPTIYSLMRKPSESERKKWKSQGIVIIPFNDYSGVPKFFLELKSLSKSLYPDIEYIPAKTVSEINYDNILSKWTDSKDTEALFNLIQEQLELLADVPQKESFILNFLGIIPDDQKINLTPHMVALNTSLTDQALVPIFRRFEEGDNSNYFTPNPDPHVRFLGVHAWLLSNWYRIFNRESGACFSWLLQSGWEEFGINRKQVFNTLLNTILNSNRLEAIETLYDCASYVEGAQSKIDNMAKNKELDASGKASEWTLKNIYKHLSYESNVKKLKTLIKREQFCDYKEKIIKASKFDDSLDDEYHSPYIRHVAEVFLDDYMQLSYLTIHGSNSNYDPDIANEILEAFSSLTDLRQQLTILSAIDRLQEDGHRGRFGWGEHLQTIREELFARLWWRFSTQTRLEYLKGMPKHAMFVPYCYTGQEYLIENIMGLRSNPDRELRDYFNSNISNYVSKNEPKRYDPFAMQDFWREKELTYVISEEVPQEIIRRIAVGSVDWINLEKGKDRWETVKILAKRNIDNDEIGKIVSAEARNYHIDNLLGAYYPNKVEIIIYDKMIKYTSNELGISADALSTIVFIHETVHAFSHIGRDLDGRYWTDYSIPLSSQPDSSPSVFHESIAQYYTYKLIEYLGDNELMKAFRTFEEHLSEEYRIWRKTKEMPLEKMREILIGCRNKPVEWPPK